jgi:hydrogenase expression/formation protein HypC
MCLAVPMKLIERDGDHGEVEVGGARSTIVLSLVPDVKTGDWLVVHAGYALEILDEREAELTLNLLRQMGEGGA